MWIIMQIRIPTVLFIFWLTSVVAAQDSDFAIRSLNGRLAIFCSDRPIVPNMFFNTSWKVEVVADSLTKAMARGGIRLHQFDVKLDWSEDFDKRDLGVLNATYRTTDERMLAILKIDPDALFLFRVHVQPPRRWAEANPGEILTAEDGTRIDGGRWYAAASYASTQWRSEGAARLNAFIRHLQLSSLSKHVMGFLLFAGWSGEWNWWRPPRGNLSGQRFAQLANMCVDHSPAMRHAFREWARRRYMGDLSVVRRVWGFAPNALVSFKDINTPAESQVQQALSKQLNSGSAAQNVADYFACNSVQVADTLLAFAHAVKGVAPNKLCGAFFGEFLFGAIGGNREILRVGHLAFNRVLRSPDIDFIATPQAYQSRALGEHAPSMTLVDSAALHGKLVFYEFDQPTHLAWEDKNFKGRDAPRDMAGTLAILRRAFAYVLCKGLGVWWWDQAGRSGSSGPGGRWYRNPEIAAEFGRFQDIWAQSLRHDRRSISEVAVLLDLRSPLWQRATWRDLTYDLLYEQLDSLGALGAPYDIYSLADLEHIPNYKLYIVLNAFWLDDDTRALMRQFFNRQGISVLWFYAPGALGTDSEIKSMATRVRTLTGISVQLLNGPQRMIVEPSPPFRSRCPKEFGSKRTVEPAFAVSDKGVTVIARYMDSGAAAVVLREKSSGITAYSAIAPLPGEVLREIALRAGCHIYSERGEVVYACRSYLAVHIAKAGNYELRLPMPMRLYDVFEKRGMESSTTRVQFSTTVPTTKLFRLLRDDE